MPRRTQVAFIALVCIYSQTGAVQILSCKTPISYVEKLDEFHLLCYGSGDRTSGLKWTLTDDSGTSVSLGTCPTINNCTTPSSLAVSREFSQTSLFFRDTGLSGNVTCTESFVNGSEESSDCMVKAMKIKMDRKKPTFSDDNDGNRVHFTCRSTPHLHGTVAWTLTTCSGQTLDLGNCTDVGVCSSPLSPNVTVKRSSETESRVEFLYFQREELEQLRCSFISDGVTEYDGFIAYAKGGYEDTENTTEKVNWKFVGVMVALAAIFIVLLIVLYRRGTFKNCPCCQSTRFDVPQTQGCYAYDTKTSVVSEVDKT